LRLAAALLLGVVACAGARAESPCAGGPSFGPFDAHGRSSLRDRDGDRAGDDGDDSRGDDSRGHDARGAADGLIAWYQRALRRPEMPDTGCPFYPSCSTFARRALDRWGVLAFVLIADRLFVREHPWAAASYPVHCAERRALMDDPVP